MRSERDGWSMGEDIANERGRTTIINYVVWDNNVMAFLIITRNDVVGWLMTN